MSTAGCTPATSAVMDADGDLAWQGRLTEMFKSGGYNVYPREIEIALEGHPRCRYRRGGRRARRALLGGRKRLRRA